MSILRTHTQQMSGVAQGQIADFMTVGIVDTLEVVQIQHQQPHSLTGALAAGYFDFQGFTKMAVIEKSGKVVDVQLVQQAPILLPQKAQLPNYTATGNAQGAIRRCL